MAHVNENDLYYILIDSRVQSQRGKLMYDECFRLWNAVWSETLLELDGTELSISDEFTRQEIVGGLFLGNVCIGLSCFRSCDLRLRSTLRDSYFKTWDASTIAELTTHGHRALVTTHLTVDRDHRGPLLGTLRMKDLLVALQIKVLLESDCDVQPLVPRCDRGMDRVVYRYGAVPLVEKASLHGVDVSLTAAYRELLSARPPSFELPIERIWKKRILFTVPSEASLDQVPFEKSQPEFGIEPEAAAI